MPALLTSTSIPPSSPSAHAANTPSPSRSARSTAHARDSGADAWQRSRTPASRSARRAQIPTVAPAFANATAAAAPIPDDAPVTRTREPASSIGGVSGTAQAPEPSDFGDRQHAAEELAVVQVVDAGLPVLERVR